MLEPDGIKGHWIKVDPALRRAAHIGGGDPVNVTVQATPDWPEPDMPPDLAAALAGAPQEIRDIWNDITPMARWEWVRWVNATASPATRQRRVEVTISKMTTASGGRAASTLPHAQTQRWPRTASFAVQRNARCSAI